MPVRIAPSCRAVLTQASLLYRGRAVASDGLAASAKHTSQNPGSDHEPDAAGWVHAVDLTHDPAHGLDADKWAHDVVARRDSRVLYVISRRQMASSYPARGLPAWTWRPYTGTNPHDKHAHVSIHRTDQARNDTSSWFGEQPAMFRSQPVRPASTTHTTEVDFDMAKKNTRLVEVTHLDKDGNGWVLVEPTVFEVDSLTAHTPNHPADGGYKNTAEFSMQQYDQGSMHTLVCMTDAAALGGGTFWLKWTSA